MRTAATMHRQVCALLLLALTAAVSTEKVTYDGYKGFQITTPDESSVELVKSFESLYQAKLLLAPSTHRACEVAVPPGYHEAVIWALNQAGIHYKVLYDDLGKEIEAERTRNNHTRLMTRFRAYGDRMSMIYRYFPEYYEVIRWLEGAAARYSKIAQVVDLGQTYEGRNQMAIKIGSFGEKKPVIWIDGGIHAREWVTVPAVLYIAHQLLMGYEKGNPQTKELLDKYDFYLLPIFNPDGYVHTHGRDRLWRKNKTPNGRYQGCAGVDLNRNFGHMWAFSGVSHYPCDQTYPGRAGFSEPETQNVRDALLKLRGRLQFYMNLHAYGQLWFLPWGYDSHAPNPHVEDQRRVAEAGAEAIYSMRGTRYRVGKPGELLYDAAGGTFDWAHAEAGAKYAFAAELSPDLASGGRRGEGFLLHPSEIRGVVTEVYQGIRAAIDAM